jgi:hypothetical protein
MFGLKETGNPESKQKRSTNEMLVSPWKTFSSGLLSYNRLVLCVLQQSKH